MNNSLESQPRRELRICFVSLYAYSLFNRSTSFQFGGAEVRTSLFATGLASLPNHKVDVVVFNHRQPPKESFGSVTIHAHSFYKHPQAFRLACYRDEVLRNFRRFDHPPYFTFHRFTFPLLWKTIVVGAVAIIRRVRTHLSPHTLKIGSYLVSPDKFRILEAIDADVYCVIGVNNIAVDVAAFCKARKKLFILIAASDVNFSAEYRPDSRKKNAAGVPAFLLHYAISNADLIITQTQTQAVLLQERFGRSSVTINNPIDLSGNRDALPLPHIARTSAVWIGKSDHIKRPDILLRLAEALPDVHFEMVMNRSQQAIHEQIIQNLPPNVNLREYVAFNQIEKLFSNALVLVNTSAFEGFPNTFLQAGKYGVPIVSLNVDPDGYIERNGCGTVAHNVFEELVEGVRRLKHDPDWFQRCSQNVRAYVYEHHELDKKIGELDAAIRLALHRHEAGHAAL